MHELLERLGRGDTRILEMCARANQAWTDFFVGRQFRVLRRVLAHGHLAITDSPRR